ncbi:tRNA glutamyl-Q(34) synthetase GluQRS [uncultured Thiothrix sp.]|uniref:tRNA glutamyl-Q(34) synthetase GluQRS n=1 Tax=uncultured Thiothrix sp. TaxID=223185 RepID=UPI0026268A8E|nr:tRNA glutamyl-Q(34) synthetase GluQRS [uncultured Thiothrix sp.]
MTYIGRFAPSPTGLLHFGSLLAATASYLQARSQQGQWLLRIEDLDKPREPVGAADAIIQTLGLYGFEWDQTIVYQSQRIAAYTESLNSLKPFIYGCNCSRKQLQTRANQGDFGLIYPRICRDKYLALTPLTAIRIKTLDQSICFHDQIQGFYCQNLERELGDFVIRRADQIFAYQLAVVVDDAWQGITEIVRGSDLLDNTPRQIYLQQLLGYSTPSYAHIPIAINALGQKLSKQTLAPALTTQANKPLKHLVKALEFLGQNPANANSFSNLKEFWDWAIANWDLNKIPKQLAYDPLITT